MDIPRLISVVGFCISLAIVIGCATGESARCGDFPASPPFSDSGEVQAALCWWTSFGDPDLNRYVNQAFADSYTLESALQRVCEARAIFRREASDLLIDLNGRSSVASTYGPGPSTTTYQLGFDVAYQVDLWGEIGSRVRAQELRVASTCADYRTVALTLSGDIASTWFSLIEAHAQIELLDEQIESNRKGLEIQESRFELGLIRIADVLRQQQLLESTLEQAVVAESRMNLLEHQLAVLLGHAPQQASYETNTVLPELPELPNTGLPSELILRRPDIRRDYLALCAADRDLASAVSAQYPRLDLSASLTNIADDPSNLLRDWFTSIGGQLIAPLFDGGQRLAEVERACAFKRRLFNEYSQTVLTAFREVEDSLAQEKFQIQRIEHIQEQVRLAGQAYQQLREQYLIGDAEYLDVLSAITGQQSLQRQLLSAQLELRLIRVSLYLALAGGFDPEQCCEATALIWSEPVERPDLEVDEETTVEPTIDDREGSEKQVTEDVNDDVESND